MAASTVQNPSAPIDSKSAKKKKTKAERTESPAPAATMTPDKPASVAGNDGAGDDANESPYVRELQKYAQVQSMPAASIPALTILDAIGTSATSTRKL
jgi:hypothetical protein